MTNLPTDAIEACTDFCDGEFLADDNGRRLSTLAKAQLAALKAKIADDAVTIAAYDKTMLVKAQVVMLLETTVSVQTERIDVLATTLDAYRNEIVPELKADNALHVSLALAADAYQDEANRNGGWLAVIELHHELMVALKNSGITTPEYNYNLDDYAKSRFGRDEPFQNATWSDDSIVEENAEPVRRVKAKRAKRISKNYNNKGDTQ